MTTHASPDVRRDDAIGTPPRRPTLVPADLTVMCSRPRPDPDHGEPVMMLRMRMPPGAPRGTPADVRLTADQAEPGLVLSHDNSVLAGLQRGVQMKERRHAPRR